MALLKRILILATAVLLCGSPAVEASDLRLYEREIKAGLLYNFLKYTDWPEERLASSPSMTVCLFGGDPFGGALEKTKGRTVHQRPIVIRTVSEVRETGSCNLVFVNERAESRWPELSAFLDGKSVLTVSDFGDFSGRGGMIEFTRKGERVTVLINIDEIRAAKLTVQDRLLKLATVVKEGKR
jgi:hypothetical protein